MRSKHYPSDVNIGTRTPFSAYHASTSSAVATACIGRTASSVSAGVGRGPLVERVEVDLLVVEVGLAREGDRRGEQQHGAAIAAETASREET